MTEIPEHLLQRSRERRRAAGQDVPGAAPAEAPAQSANAPAVVASAAPAASKAPVPIPAGAAPPPKTPTPVWVAAAESRKKIPYWVMPVLLFLPIWLIMYVGTLEEPLREEGALYEGSQIYVEAGCVACHGADGGGGTGPPFVNGAVISTFSEPESQMAWMVHGSAGFTEAGLSVYGDAQKPIGGYNGAAMPGFGAELTAEEIILVTFYVRIEKSGHEVELPLAEALYEKIESGELGLPENFAVGPEGDFAPEIRALLAEVRAEVAATQEVAAG